MPEVKKIMAAVCRSFDITEAELLSRSRVGHLVSARMITILMLKKNGYSDERIGKILLRKRATVTIMRNRATYHIGIYADMRDRYNEIKNKIEN